MKRRLVSKPGLYRVAQLIQDTSILFAARRGPGRVPAVSRTLANGGARFLYREPQVVKSHPIGSHLK